MRTARMRMKHAARNAKTINDLNGNPTLVFSTMDQRKEFVSRMNSLNGLNEWSKLKVPDIGKKLHSNIRRLCLMASQGVTGIEFFKERSKISYLEDSLGIVISDSKREQINKKIESAISDFMSGASQHSKKRWPNKGNACSVAIEAIRDVAAEALNCVNAAKETIKNPEI
jgi:hypothetical protein